MAKPLLIYDGECHFCCRWIERWRVLTGDRVEYRTAQEAAGDFPEISADDFSASVQWIGEDGGRASGAEAVLKALATATGRGRLLLGWYQGSSWFARMAEAAYRVVAENRGLFSRLTRLLWGKDVRPPTYAIASGGFLRLLGAVYLIAFLSFYGQLDGLIGSRGILPAAEFFPQVRQIFGSEAYWQWPSLCWLGASDAALHMWCTAGIGAAVVLIAGFAPTACLIFLWADYLSLTLAGQVFYQFQWDILLLETGFMAIFLSPLRWRIGRMGNPPRAAHFLLIWLLFRLMFASGVVKLSSGDVSWAQGTALDFHYFTQPLPTPVAWFAQQLPTGFQWLSVKILFFIELVLPFFLFAPRRLRLLAAGGIALLQVLIALTGNYGFFNLLTIMLCLLAVDDAVWGKYPPFSFRNSPCLPSWVLWPVAGAIVLLSLVPLASSFRRPVPLLEPLAEVYQYVAPFRTINGYGLFAVMTKERREIIVQGSDDGVEWKTYAFRFKPDDPHRAPPWVAPYMPRLDWQMWFAALGRVEQNPWFFNFLQRLQEASPPVLKLLETDPFAGRPPRLVRAQSDQYTFTTGEERRRTGDWWRTEPAAIYCPAISLR